MTKDLRALKDIRAQDSEGFKGYQKDLKGI
jgi:hypothetical protein